MDKIQKRWKKVKNKDNIEKLDNLELRKNHIQL